MKPLLVSSTLPGKISESSHGMFRRLDLFVDALKIASGSFDALFFVPAHIDTGPENTRRVEQLLSDRWRTEIKVTLSKKSDVPTPRNTWELYFTPAFSFHRIPNYAETSGQYQIKALESCLDKNPSFILAQRLHCMPPILLTRRKLPPVFFDTTDIEHIAFKRSITMPPHWNRKWMLNLQIPSLISGEKRSIKLARKTFVCSSIEKLLLAKYVDGRKIEVTPNAVNIPEYQALTSVKQFMILGLYGYAPNKIGAEYFIDQVWGIIFSQMPDSKLIVAGPEPEKIRHFKSPPPGVVFTGFVENLEELYKSIRVVVCPILSGAGTRVKLVEAAAFGKPIVSTTIGAEGLEFEDGKNALLRDDPESMAEACIAIMQDDTLANRLAEASRKLAQENYECSAVARKIANVFTNI